MIASLVFLTPWWALLALAALVPLGALALAARRERRARDLLGLDAPAALGVVRRAAVLALVPALLGLAAAQPALRSRQSVAVRTDAEAFYVFDISRSMLAAPVAGGTTRLARARAEALELRQRLAGIPAGVAVLTDHVLPDLFPTGDPQTFEQTVRQAVQVGNPPPATNAVTATTLGAIGALATQGFYSPGVQHRVAIVLTDGESVPFDVAGTARALAGGAGVTLVVLRVGSGSDAVFDANGEAEPGYHPDPAAAATVAGLVQAAHGRAFAGQDVAAAAAAVRGAVGAGPTHAEGTTLTTRTLAPYVALAALLPLLALLGAAAVPRLATRLPHRASMAAGRPAPARSR